VAHVFDAERFVMRCRSALQAADALAELAVVIAEALADRAALRSAIAPGQGLRVSVLCEGPELTVVQFVTPKDFAFPPHEHAMVSAVGVYAGAEQNVYYETDRAGLRESRRRLLSAGDVAVHAADVIHSIASAGDEPLAALHVYGGDFFHAPRSEWRGSPFARYDYDTARLRALAASGR
jgi:predicted metal-dependent enzyme (double-stranded beta helix superfamily)